VPVIPDDNIWLLKKPRYFLTLSELSIDESAKTKKTTRPYDGPLVPTTFLSLCFRQRFLVSAKKNQFLVPLQHSIVYWIFFVKQLHKWQEKIAETKSRRNDRKKLLAIIIINKNNLWKFLRVPHLYYKAYIAYSTFLVRYRRSRNRFINRGLLVFDKFIAKYLRYPYNMLLCSRVCPADTTQSEVPPRVVQAGLCHGFVTLCSFIAYLFLTRFRTCDDYLASQASSNSHAHAHVFVTYTLRINACVGDIVETWFRVVPQ